MAYEDFTTYTEVDEDNDITVSQNQITVDTMRRDAASYVHKDFGSGAFGDFEIQFEATCSAVSGNGASVVVLGLTNSGFTHEDALQNNEGILVYFYYSSYLSPTDQVVALMRGSDQTQDLYYFSSIPSTFYFTLTRSGSTVDLKIYSDAARTNLLDTLTVSDGTVYRYLSPLMSRDHNVGGVDSTMTLNVKNFEIISGGASTTTTTTTQSTTTTSTTAPGGTSTSSSTSSSTTTSTQSTSTTTTTEVPPCKDPANYAYDAPQEWTHNESNWAGRTMRYIIPASSLRAGGSEVSVYFTWFGLDYEIGKCYIGHQASSGHEYDFDGNQVQVTFNGGFPGATVTSPGEWSDQVAFSLDPSKNLVVAVYFVDNGIPRGPLEPNVTGYWKDGDDAATTDAVGYSLLPTYTAQRVIDVVCVSAGLTTTSTTTTSSTTSSSTTTTGPGATGTTTSSSTTTSTQSTTCTTTTSGPYWSWYQDRPVFLVDPNWVSPLDSDIDDPTEITAYYGKEYRLRGDHVGLRLLRPGQGQAHGLLVPHLEVGYSRQCGL